MQHCERAAVQGNFLNRFEPFYLPFCLIVLKPQLRLSAYQSTLDTEIHDIDHDTRTDLDLVDCMNRGDLGAFEVLYRRYRDWVATLACRFTQDEDLALDVLQETFLYLLRKFPGFELRSNFKTFLYPAIKNLSIAARNKARRYQSTEAEMAAVEDAATPVASGSSDEMRQMLSRLSEEHREVLLLRFLDGLDLAEIARAMDVPLGTVKSRLHHALATLKADPKTKRFFE